MWLAVFVLSASSAEAWPARVRAPGQVGTVDTVAGPLFCEGPAVPDDVSGTVGTVAADLHSAGTVWYEAGDSAEGLLTKVVNTASILVVRTGATVAAGPSGDGSGATGPGVAADADGGVLIARPTAVLRFAETAGLATLAGTMPSSSAKQGGGGTNGDGGPLASSRFTRVAAMTTDAAGNVYVADELDPQTASIAIRFLNRSPDPVSFYPGSRHQLDVAPGTVATIAGATQTNAPIAPNLTATAPTLAVVGERLYLGSNGSKSRRRAEVRLLNMGAAALSAHGKTTAPGDMITVATVTAGSGTAAASGPGLTGIAADGQGNLFLAEGSNHRVVRVDATGAATTYAGTGRPGFNGNGRPATTARLNRLRDVEVGAGGRVYISDAGNSQMRFVDQSGVIHAALGNGAATRWRCAPGPGSANSRGATPSGNPASLAADERGNLYVGSEGMARVHRLAPSATLHPVAGRLPSSCGRPEVCEVTEGAPATGAGLVRPDALAVRPGGGLYVLEGERVRFVNFARRTVRANGRAVAPGAMRTVAELRAGGGTGAATSSSFHRGTITSSGALAADRRGNLFVAEAGSGQVRRVDSSGATTTVVAAPTARDGSGDLGRCCIRPGALALDATGNLYVADVRELGRVWFLNRGTKALVVHGITVAPGEIEAVAGSGRISTRDDGGRAVESQIGIPSGVALDRSGDLYVVDHLESTVRRIDADGTITTAVGTGGRGFNGDGLKGPLTALQRPTQVVVDACGNLIVADTGNDRLRRLNLVASCLALGSAAAPSRGSRSSAALAGSAMVCAVLLATGLLLLRARRRSPGPRPENAAPTAP